eukprot:COSAG02_NODE_22432_length_753_cov_0.698777_1_plen_165_part_10
MLVQHAIEEAEQADWAATKIQSLYRGRTGRAAFMHHVEEHVDELERVRRVEQAACVLLQSHVRRLRGQGAFSSKRQAAVAMQAATRGMLTRKRFDAEVRSLAATRLQTAWRCWQQRRSYVQMIAARTVQVAWRASCARSRFLDLLVEDVAARDAVQATSAALIQA